jgi:hypothetical protein
VANELSPDAQKLLDLLLRQQSKHPPHRGQFGDHPDQSDAHQPGVERIDSKPRLYMTLWPCRILRKYNLAPAAIKAAIDSVEALFPPNGFVMGEEDTDPVPGLRQRFTSYRHSLCGALILFENSGLTEIPGRVLDVMLDRRGAWRAADRGWVHGDARPGQSDLYGSLYAAEFLAALLSSTELDSDVAGPAGAALETTLDYVEREWEKTAGNMVGFSPRNPSRSSFARSRP